MSYIVPFQSIALFENTFKNQINKETGKVENRKFVFDKLFGDSKDNLPVEADRYRLIWMPGCPHSNKAVITLRLLGLDRVISIGECGVLRDPRGWVISIAYKVVLNDSNIKPLANTDAINADWYDIKSLEKDKLAFDHYEIIQQVLKNSKG